MMAATIAPASAARICEAKSLPGQAPDITAKTTNTTNAAMQAERVILNELNFTFFIFYSLLS